METSATSLRPSQWAYVYCISQHAPARPHEDTPPSVSRDGGRHQHQREKKAFFILILRKTFVFYFINKTT